MTKPIERMQSALEAAELDAFLTSHLPNVCYLSGYTGSNGLVYISADRRIFLTDSRYEEQVKHEVSDFEVFIPESGSLTKKLLEVIADSVLEIIGFEAAHTAYKQFAKLAEDVGEEHLKPTEGLVENLRMQKRPDEIEKIREAIRINDLTFSQILERIKPGQKEYEVAAEIDYLMRKNGATKPSFDTIVAAGPNGALPHARPSDRPLARGDLVVIDMGCFYAGYASDMTRTIAIGQPDTKQRDVYQIVLDAHLKARDFLAPDKKAADMDLAARDHITSKGYGDHFKHSLGHGVGLEVHEGPRISKESKATFEVDMVVTNEPGIYIPDWGGVRIEDILRVTEDGCEVMTQTTKDLIIIE